jgi:hypothetical protein
MFHGAITALITPFKNGRIDEEAFYNLVEWQNRTRHSWSSAMRYNRGMPDTYSRRT